jgi:hypothetical protein
MKHLRLSALPALFLALACGFLPAQEQPKIQEEVVVRWWLVPVYAMNKDGSPALDLTTEDFEVYINDKKIPFFDLHKKEFQVAESTPESAVPKPAPPFEKKMVLLVFDSAFSTYNLLEKAKKIAVTMMAQEGRGAQFIALSIEPFAGLRTICGPTHDQSLVAKNVEKYITGKKAEYLRISALDSTEIRNIYPPDSPYADRNPEYSRTPGRLTNLFERLDTREKRRIASVYTQSLMTLNLILGYFKDNSKVIYLFSCGIPTSAMEWKTESHVDPTVTAEPGVNTFLNITPDQFNLRALKDVAKYFNQNGSLLFLINPSGTRVPVHDQDSGEQSLRILADESGGRYYDGPENDIAREIAGMETAYYEVSFPDSDEYQGRDMDFEIRPKNPDVQIYTVKRVSRGKDYVQMTRLEREVLILNLLDRGPYSQAKLKVVEAEFKASREDDVYFFAVALPGELAKSEWDIYKVWRQKDTGKIMMEEDSVATESSELTVDMKQREGFRHELVLVNGRTGTTLVLQQ